MITVYWSPVINVAENQEFVSELKYFEPESIYKDMNARKFFGLGASICPAIIDETKNTFSAKSPIDFHIEFNYQKQEAIDLVRSRRKGAIESKIQEDFIFSYRAVN